eukprot:SAG22_NODE_805_length_7096_cov_28.481206_4_plen_106_part_00
MSRENQPADLLRSVCQCIVTEVTVIGFKTIHLVPLPAHKLARPPTTSFEAWAVGGFSGFSWWSEVEGERGADRQRRYRIQGRRADPAFWVIVRTSHRPTTTASWE